MANGARPPLNVDILPRDSFKDADLGAAFERLMSTPRSDAGHDMAALEVEFSWLSDVGDATEGL